MHRFAFHQSVLLALLVTVLPGTLWVAAAPALAADRQKETLDALRAGGHYEEAISYLQHARANSDTPKSFADAIDYELGVTQIDWAASLATVFPLREGGERDKRLQLAQESLKKFLADHPQHALAAAARSQLGNAMFDRGRLRTMLAGQFAGSTRQQHLQSARELLQTADDFWAGVEKAAEDELNHLGFERGDDIKRSEAREQLHRRQVEARLARAWVQYELGQTYPSGSGERTSALDSAGKRFDALYDQQRERLAGFYARLGRGLCWKDLGEGEKAFKIFEELVALPDDPADFHVLRGKAAVQALEIALGPETKKYKSGMDIAQRWLSAYSDIPGNPAQAAADHSQPASGDVDLAIRFLGAEAALAYAKSLPAEPSEQAALRARQIDWARQQFTFVAAAAGPGVQCAAWSAKAKTRLLDPVFGPAASTPQAAEPGSFAEARNRAKTALDSFLAAQSAQRSGESSDVDSQRQRRQQIAATYSETLKYCRLASNLRSAAVSAEDYEKVRYYLAYLQYASGKLEEAAAVGEALAQASSDSAAARQAARVGLAAREALLQRATEETRLTATERLQVLAEKIIERWGQLAEADDARGVLLDLAVEDGRLDKARQYLQKMSDVSPRRAEAGMKLGEAEWQRAQQLLRTSTLEHDHSEEAEKTIARAAGLLGDGIAQFRKAQYKLYRQAADSTDFGGGAREKSSFSKALLALAQIHMFSGRPADALALLDDPAGTMYSGSAASGDSYSLAILAYIAVGQLDKARLCLQALQASLPPAGNAASARQTLLTCLRTRRLLKQYLARFRDCRLDNLSQAISRNSTDFFAALVEWPPARSFFISAWRAEAHTGLAEGLDVAGPGVPPAAEKQYRLAAAGLQDILERVTKESSFSPSPEATVALRIDLARCLRRLSDHPHALFQLLIILKDHPLMVDAQVEAAYTYQSWGDEKPECLDMAIQGGNQYREVWGWGELARRVQSEDRFHDVYHEARYNLAFCRLHQAQIATDKAERERLANAAENDILATQRSAPDMGGAVWYDKYNALLKRIQRLSDRPAVGLPAP
jgi:hypothetical protein